MPPLPGQALQSPISRTYNVYIPDNPPQATVPAIVVFHGGGQSVQSIASHWGIDPTAIPPQTPPPPLDRYLLVFPEADPRLSDRWIHLTGDGPLPTYDILFVDQLLTEIFATTYATGSALVPNVTVNADLVYAAGFSNGGHFGCWGLMNSDLVSRFKGFAAVGAALDPEKALHYRQQLGVVLPAPIPAIYVHGTADFGFRSPVTVQEVPLDTTFPANTVREMLARNLIPNAPSVTTLATGSGNITEVVIQLFQGGAEAFEYVTVVGGGHNWPTPTTVANPPVATHFNATQEIVEFWQNHAGLPL